MRKNSEYKMICKTVCIGVKKSGKSSFIRRLTHNTFIDEYEKTITIDFNIKCSAGNKIKFQFWDTNGRTKFITIVRSYLWGADLVPIFIDATRITESMNYLEHLTNAIADISKLVVIFTKNDSSPNSEQLTEVQIENYKQQIANKLNINVNRLSKHYITSAKTGDGIDDAFDGFINAIKPIPPFDITWNYVKGCPHENFGLFAKPVAGDDNKSGNDNSTRCVLS